MSKIDTSTKATLQRYWNPQGGGVEPHDAGLLYLRDDVDAVIAALRAERDALRAALEIAANRLQLCAVDFDAGSHESIEASEWAKEARAALKGAANG